MVLPFRLALGARPAGNPRVRSPAVCPGGGIGRRNSLRSCFPKGSAGSSPVLGTILRSSASRRASDGTPGKAGARHSAAGTSGGRRQQNDAVGARLRAVGFVEVGSGIPCAFSAAPGREFTRSLKTRESVVPCAHLHESPETPSYSDAREQPRAHGEILSGRPRP